LYEYYTQVEYNSNNVRFTINQDIGFSIWCIWNLDTQTSMIVFIIISSPNYYYYSQLHTSNSLLLTTNTGTNYLSTKYNGNSGRQTRAQVYHKGIKRSITNVISASPI
jgi:hypothetical protein